MWEYAQERDARNCRDKRHSDLGAPEQGKECDSRTEQLREVDKEMLVARVKAMLGQIRRVRIV